MAKAKKAAAAGVAALKASPTFAVTKAKDARVTALRLVELVKEDVATYRASRNKGGTSAALGVAAG